MSTGDWWGVAILIAIAIASAISLVSWFIDGFKLRRTKLKLEIELLELQIRKLRIADEQR